MADNIGNPLSTTDTYSPASDTSSRLSILKSRLRLAKTWCKKPHDSWKAWMNEYNIQDWDDTSSIRDKVRIGYLFRKTESDMPALFDDQPDIFIKGRNANASSIQPLILGLYDFLWDKQDLEAKIEDVALYFLVMGMGFMSSPWVTKTKKIPQSTQQPVIDPTTGQPAIDPQTQQPQMKSVTEIMEVPIIDNPVAEAEDPFKIFFSPETKFSMSLPYDKCPYYFKEMTLTTDEIKARFGKDVDPQETLQVDDLPYDEQKLKQIQDPDIVKDDMKRSTVYEYYGVLPEWAAKDIKPTDGKDDENEGQEESQEDPKEEASETPEQEAMEENSEGESEAEGGWEYDKDYHIFFTMSEELLVEESPYDVKPLKVLGNYGFANRFFRFGDARHLMPLIQELEFYRTQILRHTRKMANPKPLLPTSANIDENAFLDPRSGRPVKFDGPTPPSYLQPGVLGREVGEGINEVRQDLEKTAGSFDLASGNATSTVKSPKGIEVYSNASDKNTERKRKKIARFIRELLIFQFQQVGQNWKPEDGKILSITQGGQSQGVDVDAKVLEVISGVNEMWQLNIETESLSINKGMIKQDALDLFALGAQHRDIFNVDALAQDLLQNGYGKKDADRYLLNASQKAQVAQASAPQPQVNVRVMADAGSPAGAKLLENEGLLNKQDAAEAVAPTVPQMAGDTHPINKTPDQSIQQYIQHTTGSGGE